jgi:4-alpha-glucanotransferase
MHSLQELAQRHGILLAYDDATGRRREATPESLLRVLQILGAPVGGMADVADALRVRRRVPWERGLEPVSLAWEGEAAELTLRLPSRAAEGILHGILTLEGGAAQRCTWDLRHRPILGTVELDGETYVARRLTLPADLPWGYHHLEVDLSGNTLTSLIVRAPRAAYTPDAGRQRRTWGVFLPLYALHSRRSWGGGDLSDLQRLTEWVQGLGGGVIATLPLTAAFLDEPFEPSPYSPASRLFWNEFYLDVEAIPELSRCPEAQALLGSADFLCEREALRAAPLVDYRRQMALKRRVLEALARSFFREPSERQAAFERYVADNPAVEDYARFRAAGEQLRTPWRDWPAPQRDGTLSPGDYAEESSRYHRYVQWVAEEQLQSLARTARKGGPGLYLDLPLGVHGHGYDVWRERDAFAVQASGGCPPDVVFPKGQDWGFPPLHPERIREQGYRYVLAYLRRQLRYAGILRIDHIPVFHRLFWVPQGMEARDGVYVRYPAEELYAIFNLESHRHEAMLVGEDLGTVPPEVPESMERHNVQRMYVIQYAVQPDPERALPPVPFHAAASVNNHDMPPFAAYWEGRDIGQRAELGLLGGQDPAGEQEQRRRMIDALIHFLRAAGHLTETADVASVLRACHAFLGHSAAGVVLVNLEDLWVETEPQNVPSSTGEQRPNWRRKARYSFEEISELPGVLRALEEVNHYVAGEAPGHRPV